MHAMGKWKASVHVCGADEQIKLVGLHHNLRLGCDDRFASCDELDPLFVRCKPPIRGLERALVPRTPRALVDSADGYVMEKTAHALRRQTKR